VSRGDALLGLERAVFVGGDRHGLKGTRVKAMTVSLSHHAKKKGSAQVTEEKKQKQGGRERCRVDEVETVRRSTSEGERSISQPVGERNNHGEKPPAERPDPDTCEDKKSRGD